MADVDATGHAVGARGDAPGMAPSTGGSQEWIAIVAALLSGVFVLIVAQLMAFIEYQGRLARFQPEIQSRDVLYEATTRDLLDIELTLLRTIHKEMVALAAEMEGEKTEVQYRIRRVCAQFRPPPAVKSSEAASDGAVADYDRCRAFLDGIPFEGTSGGLSLPGRPRAAVWAKSNYLTSKDFAEIVTGQFWSHMKQEKSQVDRNGTTKDTGLERFNAYYMNDIVEIAKKNHDIFTRLNAQLETQFQRANTVCGQAQWLSFQLKDPRYGDVSCVGNVLFLGGAPSALASLPGAGQASSSTASDTAAASLPDKGDAGASGGVSPAQMEAQRRFDLVNQFRYYNNVSLGLAQHLLLSSPDYLASWLLVFGGAMGAMLKILFWHILPARELKWSDLMVDPARGMVCAVILFILFRSGLVMISGGGQSLDFSTLSPFFVAFVAIGAGLMSEQVIYAARRSAGGLIGSAAFQEPPRWAVGLAARLAGPARIMSAEDLAARIEGVEPDDVADWVDGTTPVDGVMQEKVSLVLGVPRYELFTDIDPKRQKPPGGAAGGGAAGAGAG